MITYDMTKGSGTLRQHVAHVQRAHANLRAGDLTFSAPAMGENIGRSTEDSEIHGMIGMMTRVISHILGNLHL